MDAPIGEEQNIFGEWDDPGRHLGVFFIYLFKCSVTNLTTLLTRYDNYGEKIIKIMIGGGRVVFVCFKNGMPNK